MGDKFAKGVGNALEQTTASTRLPSLGASDRETARKNAASPSQAAKAYLETYNEFRKSCVGLKSFPSSAPQSSLAALEKEFAAVAQRCKTKGVFQNPEPSAVRLELATRAVTALLYSEGLASKCERDLKAVKADSDLRAFDKVCSSSAARLLTERLSATAVRCNDCNSALSKALQELANGGMLPAYERLEASAKNLSVMYNAYLAAITLQNIVKSEATTVKASIALKEQLERTARSLDQKTTCNTLDSARNASMGIAYAAARELTSGVALTSSRLKMLEQAPESEIIRKYAGNSFSGKDASCFDVYARAAARHYSLRTFCDNLDLMSRDVTAAEKAAGIFRKDARILPGTELQRRVKVFEGNLAALKIAESPEEALTQYVSLFGGSDGKQGSLSAVSRLYEKSYPLTCASTILRAHAQALQRNQKLGNFSPAEAKKAIIKEAGSLQLAAQNGQIAEAVGAADALSRRVVKGLCMQADLGCPADDSAYVAGYSSYIDAIAAGKAVESMAHANANELINDLLSGCNTGAHARATALEVLCSQSSSLSESGAILSSNRMKEAETHLHRAIAEERASANRKIWNDAISEAIGKTGTIIRIGAVAGSFIPPTAPVSQGILIADSLLSASASANTIIEEGFSWSEAANIGTNLAFVGIMKGLTPGRVLAACKMAPAGKAADLALTAGVAGHMGARSYEKLKGIDPKAPPDEITLNVLDAAADTAVGVLAAKTTVGNARALRAPAAQPAKGAETLAQSAPATELDRAVQDVQNALRGAPHLQKVVVAMLKDPKYPMDIVRSIRDPLKRPVVLKELKALASTDAVSATDLKKVVETPGSHALLLNNQESFNRAPSGEKSMDILRARLLRKDPALYSIANHPTAQQEQLLARYRSKLAGGVQVALVNELQKVSASIPRSPEGWPVVQARTKSKEGISEKIERMRTGNAGRAPRPGYCLADMPDAVGGRVTVRTVNDLAAAMSALEKQFAGRIVEKDNFYVSGKKNNPYRVVTYTVLVNDVPCEVQLTTLRASLAADIGHNTLYKPIITLSADAKEFIDKLQKNAAYEEHLELTGKERGGK